MPLVARLEDEVAGAGVDDLFAQQRAHPAPEHEGVLVLRRVLVQRRRVDDPRERVRLALVDLYRWYRENEALQLHVQGERATVPELETWMASTVDVGLGQLASGLAAGFSVRGKRAERLRAHLALALDFWAWHRLSREGLDDKMAADLMADSVAAVASAQT
ncbi:MAG TPA: hypothetical protein VKB17_06335 [Thermoleophilaceae bacterium]|nr:hypothetical protein [Thermoleophilaceae bacterium]